MGDGKRLKIEPGKLFMSHDKHPTRWVVLVIEGLRCLVVSGGAEGVPVGSFGVIDRELFLDELWVELSDVA